NNLLLRHQGVDQTSLTPQGLQAQACIYYNLISMFAHFKIQIHYFLGIHIISLNLNGHFHNSLAALWHGDNFQILPQKVIITFQIRYISLVVAVPVHLVQGAVYSIFSIFHFTPFTNLNSITWLNIQKFGVKYKVLDIMVLNDGSGITLHFKMNTSSGTEMTGMQQKFSELMSGLASVD
ncbi:hypothetical protein ACJX0J_005776, partial [Zea mays]